MAADWTATRGGHVVQVGITDHIDEINRIAEWVISNKHRPTYGIDPVLEHRQSILDSATFKTRGHYRAPPTVHGHVRLVPSMPKFGWPILFLNLAMDSIAPMRGFFKLLTRNTVVCGTIDSCRQLLDEAQLTAQPLYSRGTRVSIRLNGESQ